MFDYMFFLLVGVVIMGVGMSLGKALTHSSSHHNEDAHSSLEQHEDNSIDDNNASNDNNQESNEKYDQLLTEFNDYKHQVSQHFIETEDVIDHLTSAYDKTLDKVLNSQDKTPINELVSDLTQSYQHVFTKISNSAKSLTNDPKLLQRLDARRDKVVLINTKQRINKS